MEVIVSKRCSCCTRVLPIERFRMRTKQGRRVRVAQCDQCEKGREAARWQITKMQADRPTHDRPLQDRLCDAQFRNWRGPVSPGLAGAFDLRRAG